MPWTPESFRTKHNKKLTKPQARKAASIANAMLSRGVPEGEAIATANSRAKTMSKIVGKRNRQLRKQGY